MTQPETPPASETLTAVLDGVLGHFGKDYPGIAVGATVGGVAATAATGRTRPDGPAPTATTSFQIGSVTKPFTALLLAEAVVRGEVGLEQDVISLVPGVARHPRGRPITLLDLATHASGLPRLPPGLLRDSLRHRDDPYRNFTGERLQEAVRKTPKRPPGTKIRYSNLGFGLLGEALARAAETAFADLVAARITKPLAMNDTGVGAERVADGADGHTRRGKPTVDWEFGALAGAGALRSTVSDLLRFLHAHIEPGSSPLEPAVELVSTPRARVRKGLAIGLAWHVFERPDGPSWWWHNGGTGGFASFVGWNRDRAAGVVVLANSSRSVDRVGIRLIEGVASGDVRNA